MKSLQAVQVQNVCSFFWDQYPVSDTVEDLDAML